MNREINESLISHCRVMKLADMPSRLEGGDNGINADLY
ncbi:hypothetical protein OKW21_001033 [Catalinimonas alkaloidigena]|nr:hypothetical protein [Catalinimonas alkaloidigena]